MNRILILAAMSVLFFQRAKADLAPQPQASFTQGASGTWNLDWTGVAGRTYFIQYSVDLVNWQYFPVMEFGEGTKSFGFTSSTDKFFVRLKYADVPGIENLQQAKDADFDGDGVPNFAEITTLGTDPLKKSTNGSGFADGAQDFDGDGISNAVEIALGLDPGTSNTTPASGTAEVTYSYDDVNRLTGVTSPVSTKTYQLDEEGNIQGQ